MGAPFEALDEGVLLDPLDPRYIQVGFNIISVQVRAGLIPFGPNEVKQCLLAQNNPLCGDDHAVIVLDIFGVDCVDALT